MERVRIDLNNLRHALLVGLASALLFFLLALWIGLMTGKAMLALSLIGFSIALEAQPAAVASVALGFHPTLGALISIFANLIPIPLLMLTFDQIVRRWHWVRRKLHKAEKWSAKYGRYGVWVLTALTPFIGAYLCIAIGFGLRWPPLRMFVSITLGIVISAFALTYGGHFAVGLFHI